MIHPPWLRQTEEGDELDEVFSRVKLTYHILESPVKNIKDLFDRFDAGSAILILNLLDLLFRLLQKGRIQEIYPFYSPVMP
ncbi:MAG TPA: hypothetical protein DEQ09_11925 [Bacteroidales bacterium]|nr:hypothetical protein [Bacteroidales bacterium]